MVVSEELLMACLLVGEGQLWPLDCVFHGFHESLFPICFFGLQRVGAKKKAHLSRKTKPNKCVCLEGVDFGSVGSTFHMLLSTKPCTAKIVLQCGYWSCRGTSEESKTSNQDHHSNEKLKQFLAENQDQISPT